MAEEEVKKAGNIGLPFGLCKKYNIQIDKNATPRQAWQALEDKTGKTPSSIYNDLKSKKPLINSDSQIKEKPKNKYQRLPEYFAERKKKDREFFYGNTKQVSNKYFLFDNVKDSDNITILTYNIKMIKDNPVLIVDNNKAVYLKDWQIRSVHTRDGMDTDGMNTFAVKLSRQYFKPYTFKFNFSDMLFDKEDTFDELLEIAKEQQKLGIPIAEGWQL